MMSGISSAAATIAGGARGKYLPAEMRNLYKIAQGWPTTANGPDLRHQPRMGRAG